jgi:hypothetical protein
MISFSPECTLERPTGRKKAFRWDDVNGQLCLVRVEGVPFETFNPLQGGRHPGRGREHHAGDSALFRAFAALPLEPRAEMMEAVLTFAQIYGSLDNNAAVPLEGREMSLEERLNTRIVHNWRDEITSLKVMVNVWEALEKRNWKGLRAVLPDGYFQSPASRADADDLAAAAVRFFYVRIPYQLSYRFRFGTLPFPHGEDDEVGVMPTVSWNDRAGKATIKLPFSLRDVMVYQLGLALLQSKSIDSYQACAGCGRWLELNPRLNRDDRQTCSVSCRGKLYRQRQEKARELRGKGWPAKRIAKELGSNVSTVKKWLQHGG